MHSWKVKIKNFSNLEVHQHDWDGIILNWLVQTEWHFSTTAILKNFSEIFMRMFTTQDNFKDIFGFYRGCRGGVEGRGGGVPQSYQMTADCLNFDADLYAVGTRWILQSPTPPLKPIMFRKTTRLRKVGPLGKVILLKLLDLVKLEPSSSQ